MIVEYSVVIYVEDDNREAQEELRKLVNEWTTDKEGVQYAGTGSKYIRSEDDWF